MGVLFGVSAVAVQRYETGRVPRAEILQRISKVTGRSVEWLLTGVDGPDAASVSRESFEPFGKMSRSDRAALKAYYEFLQIASEDRKEHVRKQIWFLLNPSSRKKAQ